MVDFKGVTLGIAFTIANTAVAALSSDWIFFKGDPSTIYPPGASCMVYNREAYNLFGSICGVYISDIESFVTTLQIMLSFSLVFALLLFFLVAFNRMRKKMIVLTTSIILGLCLSTLIIWEVTEKVNLPTTSSTVDYRGSGWFLTLICATMCLPMYYVQWKA